MQSACDNVLDEWSSLCTEEIQNIWNTERKELRIIAMVFHVLKQEFARVEFNLNHEMDNFRQKVELIDNSKKSSLPTSPRSSPAKPLQKLDNNEESQLNKSPKLNRHRKNAHLKRPSPSLLNIQKENKDSKNNLAVPKILQRAESEELFNLSICDSFEDLNADNNLIKSDVFKTPQDIKRLASVDVVDSSFIVENTPDKPEKKFKWTRKHSNLKGTQSKSSKAKEKKSFTLTQMFDNFPNKKIKVTAASGDKKRNEKSITTVRSKPVKSNLDDETFFALEEESYEDATNKVMQPKENIPISNAFFKDYDKFPVLKSASPQHVYKTETVRRKADRMKLPGWSCIECEQYYKGLNLLPDELRIKMNACSKHRNKFPLLDTTPSDYWDVAMPPTQDTQQNITFLM